MTMVYANYNKAYLTTTELYRRLTTRMPKRILLKLCYVAVPLYYVGQIPGVGPLITRLLLPVSVVHRPIAGEWGIRSTSTHRNTHSRTTTSTSTAGTSGRASKSFAPWGQSPESAT